MPFDHQQSLERNAMDRRPFHALLIGIAIAACAVPVAHADSSDATCQVRKEGETKHGASGPCTFSQRQGYIDLDLRNGDTYALRPTDKNNQYKDQKGHKVVRTNASARSQEFKWEGGKKITVTFNDNYYSGGHNKHHDNYGNSGSIGQTPPELRYLVNSRYVGGEVDDQMMSNGYRHMRNDVGGDTVTSFWRSGSGGNCVMVRMNRSRHVTYIANTANSSCR
jgi:hypothetical protein